MSRIPTPARRTLLTTLFSVVASILLLSACGGGGGGGGAAPAPGPAWGTAQLIETTDGTTDRPQIAIDPNGNALAVWQQYDGTRYNIWANRYTAGTGWGTAQLIETDNGSAERPQIAFDPNGTALAVWRQSDGTTYNIWAKLYTAGSNSWGTAQLIETDNEGDAGFPQIAIDPNGNALAVWEQSDGTRSNIWANRYDATSDSWDTAQLIETDDGIAFFPQIAIDPNGNALAVWQQDDGTRYNIWANRYTAGSNSWGTAQIIDTDNMGDAWSPQIAIDPNGNALAVWQQDDGTRYNIWANRYDATSDSWEMAQLIETGDGHALNPQIAIDANGNALAVWQQDDGTRYNIWANRYSVGSNSWGTAVLIESNDAGGAFAPQIAVDPHGNALAVWQQYDGTADSIWANRYTVGSGWGVAQLIETDNTGSAGRPQIAIDPNGNALAVWYQHDGTRYNIWANRYQQ